MADGIDAFFDGTQTLGDWLAQAEEEMQKFDCIEVQPEALSDQCQALAALADALAERQVCN